eukprot:scaffold75314_cov18-Prasinocladus_malaysianus.AAC.1
MGQNVARANHDMVVLAGRFETTLLYNVFMHSIGSWLDDMLAKIGPFARGVKITVWETTPGFGDSPLLESLWTAVDEAIELKECDLYTYNSDLEMDPF